MVCLNPSPGCGFLPQSCCLGCHIIFRMCRYVPCWYCQTDAIRAGREPQSAPGLRGGLPSPGPAPLPGSKASRLVLL